jgi:hypothetical protein
VRIDLRDIVLAINAMKDAERVLNLDSVCLALHKSDAFPRGYIGTIRAELFCARSSIEAAIAHAKVEVSA